MSTSRSRNYGSVGSDLGSSSLESGFKASGGGKASSQNGTIGIRVQAFLFSAVVAGLLLFTYIYSTDFSGSSSSSISITSSESRDWFVYKFTMVGTDYDSWYKFTKNYLSSDTYTEDLGCNGTKVTGNLGDIQLHYVDADVLDSNVTIESVSYWEEMMLELYGDMSTFYAPMNNKLQIVVPSNTFADIDMDLRDPVVVSTYGVKTMRRISTYGTTTVVHLLISVSSNIYEFVSVTDVTLDLDGYVQWAATECDIAQTINFDPNTYIQKLTKENYFIDTTDAGFVSGYWTKASVNTAHNVTNLTSVADMTSDSIGLKKTYYSSEYCEVLDVYFFTSPDVPLLKSPRRLQYVRMLDASGTADTTEITSTWERTVNSMHQYLYNNATQHYGSNWNHWLDRHIGIEYMPGGEDASSAQATKAFATVYDRIGPAATTTSSTSTNSSTSTSSSDIGMDRPMGLRLGNDSGDVNSRMYVGYETVLTIEYHLDADVYGWEQDVCSCIATNNDLDYLQRSGSSCHIRY